MKRLNIFVQAFLFCTLAFSQHPGSRGGNPLYWALVGGISAGILYVFYLLLGLLVNIIKRLKHRDFHLSEKLNSFLAKKGYEENKSRGEMHCNLPTDGEELREKSNEDNHQGVTLCKGCGKQIQAGALYCSYCGANQSRIPTTFEKISQKLKDLSFLNALLKRLVGFILILMLFALLGGTISFICHEIGGSDANQVASFFAPIAAFVLYRLLNYAYKFNHKRKNLIIITLVMLVLALWVICITDSISQVASRRAEAQRIEEMHRVNRTFLGCSFGDNASKVSNTLREYVPNRLLPNASYSGSGIDEIWLENISYGDYTLNTISFLFYQDKLYKVVMDVQTAEKESYSDLWTYNHLSTMLGKKYEKDYSARQYNNTESYCDDHTAVKLWHSTYGMGEYEVTLTYYDKDSGYKEHQEEGF
jgi:hypothetical protein